MKYDIYLTLSTVPYRTVLCVTVRSLCVCVCVCVCGAESYLAHLMESLSGSTAATTATTSSATTTSATATSAISTTSSSSVTAAISTAAAPSPSASICALPTTSVSTLSACLPAAASTLPLSLPLCPPLPLLSINGAEEKEYTEAGGEGAGVGVGVGEGEGEGEGEGSGRGGDGGAGKGESSQVLSLIVEKENEIPGLNTSTNTNTSTSTNTVISTNSSTLAAAAECPICLEEPGLAHSVITTCGHILCLVCAKLLIRVNKKCPICSCPLGEKDYVGLARLQQKGKTNNNSSSSSSNSSNNDIINGNDDNHSHEDGDKECHAGGAGNGNEVIMSTEMEVIHLDDSNSNCGHGEKIGIEEENGAIGDGMKRETKESGGGSGCEKVGGRGDVAVDAVRAVVERTVSSADAVASSGSNGREAVAAAGAGTGTGTGTGTGSEGAVVKDSYKTDDYRRWGGERFHKSVSLSFVAFHFISFTPPHYPHPLPHPLTYRLSIASLFTLSFFLLFPCLLISLHSIIPFFFFFLNTFTQLLTCAF